MDIDSPTSEEYREILSLAARRDENVGNRYDVLLKLQCLAELSNDSTERTLDVVRAAGDEEAMEIDRIVTDDVAVAGDSPMEIDEAHSDGVNANPLNFILERRHALWPLFGATVLARRHYGPQPMEGVVEDTVDGPLDMGIFAARFREEFDIDVTMRDPQDPHSLNVAQGQQEASTQARNTAS